MEKIKFKANLPPIGSAIALSGIGEGARIKLDIPPTDISAVIKLQKLAGITFVVTIEKEGKK